MAITVATRALAYLSALGKTRQSDQHRTERSLGNWLRDRYDPDRRQAFSVWQNIARQVIANSGRASTIQDNPLQEVGPADLAIDPTIRPEEERFRYRVVVEASSRSGAGKMSGAFDIDSDRTLTWNELRRIVESEWWRWFRANYIKPGQEQDWDNAALDLTLISAGRRG